MQYPVFPWTIIDFSSDKLNLNKPETFRNLSLTMGSLGDKERVFNYLERF